MLLVNRFGRVVDIQEPDVIKSMLKFKRMREATPEEVEAFHQKQTERSISGAGVTADNSFYFNTVRNSPDGYGMSRDVIKSELMRLGILPSETNLNQKVGLLYSYPNAVLQMQNDVRLIFTMFESDKIPDDWPEYLREADEVIVPSKWCQKVFKKSGVETTVVPLGYNHRVFKYIERPIPVEENKDFTFIHYNAFNVRKGFFEIMKAFEAEFEPHEPVKLILKTTTEHPPLPLPKSMYPNIEVIKGQVKDFELVNILGRANCMVFPSRGEGFGITPLEAMATGLPAIIPNAHGMSEYFNPDYMLEVKVKEKTPALYRRFKGEDVGDMVLCDIDDLRKKMRYAYNHQREMKQLGKKASEYVKQWTYENTAKMLAEIINKWMAADVPKRPESKFLFVDKI